MRSFLKRLRGQGKQAPPRHSLSWMIWSWFGGFIGIWLVGASQQLLDLSVTDHLFLIGSFGASAVLIYGTPHVPYAQPRNLVGGHVVSALVGVAVSQHVHLPLEVVAALAVANAIFFMHLTATLHPPGGATALIAVIGSERIQELGYLYVLQPVLTGILLMLLIALIINNLRLDEQGHYPKWWW